MTYDEVHASLLLALRESGLPSLGANDLREAVEARSTDRTVKSVVGTLGQDAEPLHIGAALSWRWIHAARTATTEEDLLTEFLGRESGRGSRDRGEVHGVRSGPS